MKRKLVENECNDQERAYYHATHTDFLNISITGLADGESAFKECRDIGVKSSLIELRYPFWHNYNLRLASVHMTSTCRAALWYDQQLEITNSKLYGIKALRECQKVKITDSKILSPEFGWKSQDVTMDNCDITSEYLFFYASKLHLSNFKMQGKYSFQYVSDMEISNAVLDTKDAFWHSKRVTVRDSVVRGEYLGWYADYLTFINCRIYGTQPLCYCKHLKLINCEMIDCDLAFEYSDVDGDIHGHIASVKNPRSGIIEADSIGEIIQEKPVHKCRGLVKIRQKL